MIVYVSPLPLYTLDFASNSFSLKLKKGNLLDLSLFYYLSFDEMIDHFSISNSCAFNFYYTL